MSDFEVGQWVTLEASNGWKVRGKVTAVTEDGYTLQQFPDSVPWVPYASLDATESDEPAGLVQSHH